ncbi:hypothetical protein [Haloferax sp. DFSO52]|uniref:hypothetical protein n=1 Tax=Haloferax sp. DFSO52 TaxID=3388505 RepID=UPI003A89C6FE
MSTTSNTEYRVDEPTAFADLESRIGAQKAALGRLETLSDEVDGLYADAAELDTDSRKTVAEEMREVQHDFASVSTIDDLETTKNHVAEVIAAPYRQAVKRAQSTLCKAIGIESEIEDETLESLNDVLQRRDPDELRDMAASFDDVTKRLTTCPEAAQTAVGLTVATDVYGYLSAPDSKLDTLVTTVERQVDSLETIDDAFVESEWGPDTELTAMVDYYGPDNDCVAADQIVEYVETVDDRLADTDALDLAALTHTHLERGLPVSEPTNLVDLFEGLSRGVTRCAGHEQVFVDANALVGYVENPSEHGAEEVTECLEAVTNVFEQDRGEEPVKRLSTKLLSLNEAYDEWASAYAQQLTRDVVAINAVKHYLTDPPSFDAVESTSHVVDGDEDDETADAVETEQCDYEWVWDDDGPSAEQVVKRPVSAVLFHQRYVAWVDALRGQGLGEGGVNITHLLALVRGENISAADIEPDVFETLVELFGDVLILELTDSPAEES